MLMTQWCLLIFFPRQHCRFIQTNDCTTTTVFSFSGVMRASQVDGKSRHSNSLAEGNITKVKLWRSECGNMQLPVLQFPPNFAIIASNDKKYGLLKAWYFWEHTTATVNSTVPLPRWKNVWLRHTMAGFYLFPRQLTKMHAPKLFLTMAKKFVSPAQIRSS